LYNLSYRSSLFDCRSIFLFSLLLLGLNRLEHWYPQAKQAWYATVIFSLLRLGLIFTLSFADGFGLVEGSLIVLLIFFTIFLVAGKSYGLTGLIWIGYLVWRVWHIEELAARFGLQNEVSLNAMLLMSFFLIITFLFTVAYLAKQERTTRLRSEKLLQELEDSHRQLQVYAKQVGELATIEERNRLARDIHDSLGHYMTVINVQLEKAIAYREINIHEADEAVIHAKRLAGQALKDIRRSVKALRETSEPFSLCRALPELVENVGQDHFSVDLQIEGDETGYARQSLITLYRAAQEGLTNIQKHARAEQVTIQLKLDEVQGTLSISDDGCGFETSSLNNGNSAQYGLKGVQERLELIRGSFKLESSPDEGTRLYVMAPKNPLTVIENVRD
jgi:signal transduction histidine kinase